MRAWRRDGRERTRDGLSTVRTVALRLVAQALKEGRLQARPCEFVTEAGPCGRTLRVRPHHADYRRPLEVRFYCPKHRRRVDQEIGRRL